MPRCSRSHRALADYFEQAAALADPKAAANWIRGELRAQLREVGVEPWESKVTPAHLAALVDLVGGSEITVPAAKEVLAEVIASGAEPAAVVAQKGLGQIGDSDELGAIVDGLLAANPVQAQQLRDGKDKLIGFFVGQAMKATQGRADPAVITQLVKERTS